MNKQDLNDPTNPAYTYVYATHTHIYMLTPTYIQIWTYLHMHYYTQEQSSLYDNYFSASFIIKTFLYLKHSKLVYRIKSFTCA